MRTSTNYALKLMEGTDNVKRQDFVDNFEKIDTEMKILETNGIPYGGTTTGSANTYAISTPVITALVVGQPISLKFNVASTAASTLNWCGLGAKGIKKSNGADVTNLKTGIYTLRYDGTNFILQGEGANGTAIPTDLLPGKTASTDLGDIVGAMPTKVAATYTPSTLDQTISALQYLLGAQTILGDADLVSANIKSGVNIFGIVGSSTVVDTSDASLDSQYLLEGQSGYDDGTRKAGTMVNSSGTTIGSASSTAKSDSDSLVVGSATNEYVGAFDVIIPKGYYNGVSASRIHIPDLIPSNIISGKNVGWNNHYISGNASIESLGGKKYAYGTSGNFTERDSVTINLPFAPRIVTLIYWKSGSGANHSPYRSVAWKSPTDYNNPFTPYNGAYTVVSECYGSNTLSINGNSFTYTEVNASAFGYITWEATE